MNASVNAALDELNSSRLILRKLQIFLGLVASLNTFDSFDTLKFLERFKEILSASFKKCSGSISIVRILSSVKLFFKFF